MEEVVEVGELAVFREDLDQRMLVDRVMQVADVEPVFEDFSRLGLGDG